MTVPAVERLAISDKVKEKFTGLKINNMPLEVTDEEVVKFLTEYVKPDIGSENFEMKKNERNTQVIVFSGVEPDCIVEAVARIDFKETKQKILERPLYCRAMRNLTPTKQPVAEVTEKE